MRKLVVGLILGMLIGASGTALAVKMVGSDGHLLGWTVTVNGEEVCSDPYVYIGSREIEC